MAYYGGIYTVPDIRARHTGRHARAYLPRPVLLVRPVESTVR